MSNRTGIRILVIDEDSIFRRGLFATLSSQENFRVVGLAEQSDEVRRQAAELRPDVVVIDLDTRGPRLDLLRQLLRQCPEARILALAEEPQAGQALQAGAAGCLSRSVRDDELRAAVEAVHRGQTCPGSGARRLLDGRLSRAGRRPLTRREGEVLRLIAGGLSNKEVASALGISVRTVENHRAALMRKLDLRSVVGLVKYAITAGLVDLQDG
jgi:DNA-binding NarL/FixJ family response regulator